MKIATISHSHIALRQQYFFQEVTRQGHEVLMVAPGEWYGFSARDYNRDFLDSYFSFRTCKHMGDNIYTYHLLGARDLIEKFEPDWLYVQAEPGSTTAREAITWDIGKRALFTWENISIKGDGDSQLSKYDLVVCGNPESEALVKPLNPHTLLMLQVGVDTDHFRSRPDVPRDIKVGYIGRPTPEKGLPYLSRAWPGVEVLEWKDFLELPWWYSQIKVIVAYSQDVPHWKEQAPNYVVLEALSCGCKAVVSDTSSMKYWLNNFPGVVIVEGHEQLDNSIKTERVDCLKKGIQDAFDMELTEDEGRQAVIDNFSNPVMARKLLGVMENA